jgi:acyl-CoA dehydrogenase
MAALLEEATEPAPGAGSDPSAMLTTATRDGSGWRISGNKHLISGAEGASFCIVMAKDAEGPGSTMFLLPTDTPGFRIGAHARTIDQVSVGGHCEVAFDDVRLPNDAVLGEPGAGFRYAQVRLAPARLTHCMRWLGAARRAHEIAVARSAHRNLFGRRLGEHGMTQQAIADSG